MPKYNAALMSIDPSETRRYAGLNKAPNFNKKTILEACREVLYISEPKGIWEVYHSWIDAVISDYNTDFYYQSRDYIAACYKAGEII